MTEQKVQVTIYSRPGCHLCDVAKEVMRGAEGAEYCVLTEVNIDADPALQEKYKYDIPVIVIEGQEAFRYRVDPKEFSRKICELRKGEI
jgi:glutaredoxin